MLSSTFNGYPVHLVQTVDELEYIKKLLNPKIQIGFDTETTGLDFNTCETVGYCISMGQSYSTKDYHGFYIPVRHRDPEVNLPLDKVVEFMQFLMDHYKTIFWNRNFDFHFMEKDGIKISPKQQWHDAQAMAFLATQEGMPALKKYAERFLKWDTIHYEDNNAENGSFGNTDPRVSYIYAAGDPVMTCMLGRKLWTEFPEIHNVYTNIDNYVLEAFRYFTTQYTIPIDYDQIEVLLNKTNQELSALKAKIFAITGYEFRLTAASDKADALTRVVTLTKKTASGKYDTSIDTLSHIDHPLAKLLVEYSHKETYRHSFVDKMMTFKKIYPEGIHVNYYLNKVSTGRTASGASSGNPFFAPINIQNIPKTEIFKFVHFDDLLGYRVDLNPENAIGKMKVKGGLRDAFTAPDGYVFLNADFAAEELRVMANLSGEPHFINPILEGKDLHTYVAKQMFGFEDKSHRTKVKILNFSIAYGANEYTIAERLGIPVPEAKELYDNYFKTLKKFDAWRKNVIAEARRKKIVFTPFGRPRNLFQYYNSSDSKQRAFADRTALNSPVQGFGGDLIRICHIKLWQRFLTDPEFAANCRYHSTVHDEISLLVKPAYIYQAYNILKDIMYFFPKQFKVPIVTEPAIGYSWGTLCEAERMTENGHIILNRGKCDPLDGVSQEEFTKMIDDWESRPGY